MNILEELQKDHDEVENLFSQIGETKDIKNKKKLLEKIEEKLLAHNHAEEDVFYKKLKEQGGQAFLAVKSEEEHDLAEQYMNDLKEEEDEVRWEAKLEILKTLIENHILDEEEEVFDATRQAFKDQELEDMGKEFLSAKEKDR